MLEPERKQEFTEVLMMGIENLKSENVERIREAMVCGRLLHSWRSWRAIAEEARFHPQVSIERLVGDFLDQVELAMQSNEAETLCEIPLVANQEKKDFVAHQREGNAT